MKKIFLAIIALGMMVSWTPKTSAQLLPQLDPLVITNILLSEISDTTATVSWVTSLPASGRVDYGTTSGYGQSVDETQNLLLIHTATLTDLTPGTLYHYRVTSTNALGTTASSTDQSFTTTCSSSSCAPQSYPTPNTYTYPSPYSSPYSSPYATPRATDSTTNNFNLSPSTTSGSTPGGSQQTVQPSNQSQQSSGGGQSQTSRTLRPSTADANANNPLVAQLPLDANQSNERSFFDFPTSYVEWLFWIFLLVLILCSLAWVLSPVLRRNISGQYADEHSHSFGRKRHKHDGYREYDNGE